MAFRVGIIGCGRPWKTPGAVGFGMSNFHAEGYNASPDARVVALADINLDNARAFQAVHGGDNLYADYHEMLGSEQLDVVSIATWPHLHAPMVIAAAEAGVKAIHCEKPMAPSYADALAMVEACERNNVQLSFNHQRRFGASYREARTLLKTGAIGTLKRMEGHCGNLFDWGTHWFDMFNFYNDENGARWVLGQVDWREGNTVFGVTLEGQGMSLIGYENDVQGLILTGEGITNTVTRLFGTEGMIEAGDGVDSLRIWASGDAGWRNVPLTGDNQLGDVVARGVFDLLDALKGGREPELSGRRALRAAETMFATYESSKRGGRIDLPLEALPSPFPKSGS
jgi:UDP-N-acetylglucosamine 3-dehydrogenase